MRSNLPSQPARKSPASRFSDSQVPRSVIGLADAEWQESLPTSRSLRLWQDQAEGGISPVAALRLRNAPRPLLVQLG